MKIIGRNREKDILEQCLASGRPEFIVVYGRRRVGKTYLIKQFFKEQFAFYATGISDEKSRGQLRAFNESLKRYGCGEKAVPKDWFEAFSRLRDLLTSDDIYRDPVSGRKVVFLDEMPWMDTQRSDFRSALDYFWNSWGSSQEDLVLIVCGSATSWIIDNLLKDTRGFHNRVTRRIRLMPFSLNECEQLIEYNGVTMPRWQLIESYMVFGGIPYYLNLLDPRLSLSQNIDELCFKPYGELREEYYELFRSLFRKPEKHIAILETLAGNKNGMTRVELADNKKIGGGSVLTKDLLELEQCGFIRKYSNFNNFNRTKSWYYQLIDPFTLFSIKQITNSDRSSWLEFINSPGYVAWRGNAFEIVCLNHIDQIKAKLGIQGVETREYGWKSNLYKQGAQIDLIIDRKDGVVNLCEMKFTEQEYELDKEECDKLMIRMDAFRNEMRSEKAIHLTMITAKGLKKNKYSGMVQNAITGEDLFI